MVVRGVAAKLAGAAAGLLAAAAGLGVSQLAAGLTGPAGSPVVAVGQAAIDLAPAPAKNFAISSFGTADKPVLLIGELLVIAAVAAATGIAAARRLSLGLTAVALFAALGLAAALTRPDATPAWAVPALAGTAVTGFALIRLTASRPPGNRPEQAGTATFTYLPGPQDQPDRRRFLITAGAAAATGAAGTLAGRQLAERYDVSAARAALRLPRPAVPAPPLPPAADLRIPGLSPFISPNGGFYRVDTALLLPEVDPASWQLRIHGMVSRELRLSFAELLRLPLIEDYITLTCVSDPVGGPYAGNAKWLGASLAGLIRRAGPLAGADQLLCTSADGFTSGTPLPIVLDGRDALLAVAMNGVPLPVAHGFPARLVVPGLYGYVSATKWVTDIEVTRFADSAAYWVTRGWAQQAPIKTESRIDVPAGGATLARGSNPVAGVAWAQHKGITAVEIRVDQGPWRQAELAEVPGIDTWRQWVWRWDAPPGTHLIEARATDLTGYTQTPVQAPPAPDGASGYPSVSVTVR